MSFIPLVKHSINRIVAKNNSLRRYSTQYLLNEDSTVFLNEDGTPFLNENELASMVVHTKVVSNRLSIKFRRFKDVYLLLEDGGVFLNEDGTPFLNEEQYLTGVFNIRANVRRNVAKSNRLDRSGSVADSVDGLQFGGDDLTFDGSGLTFGS